MDKYMIDAEDIRDWAAYKRNLRREREQRMSMIIVAVALVAGAAIVLASLVVKVRREAREQAELMEMLGGAQ